MEMIIYATSLSRSIKNDIYKLYRNNNHFTFPDDMYLQ